MNSTRTWVTPPREPVNYCVSLPVHYPVATKQRCPGFEFLIDVRSCRTRSQGTSPAPHNRKQESSTKSRVSMEIFHCFVPSLSFFFSFWDFVCLSFSSFLPPTFSLSGHLVQSSRSGDGMRIAKGKFVPVRPRTRVTLTNLTGALDESIVKDLCFARYVEA